MEYEYELYHYGVKGMKWGVRRARLKSAKQLYRDRKNQAFSEYEREINDIERSYKRGQNLSKADLDREQAADKKYADAVAKAKSDYEITKKGIKSPQASNYSTEQRIRDRKLYGRGAEKRINERMLKGEGLQSARHNEVVRKERIESGKTIAKNVAKGALVAGGAAAVATVLSKKGFGSRVANDVVVEQVVNIGRSVINAMFK